jgi:hypothetical protein
VPTWHSVTSTLTPTYIALFTTPKGRSLGYGLFQAFGGPQPHTVLAARVCCSHHANYGNGNAGVTWTGTCAALTASPADQAWGSYNSFLSTSISSSFDNSLPVTPASYTVTTAKNGMLLRVDTADPDFEAMVAADLGRAVGTFVYEVDAVTADTEWTATAVSASVDWTGVLRAPASGVDAMAHYITPADLAGYPQIATLTPGVDASLTFDLIQDSGTPTTFAYTVYLSTDLGELDAPDVGASSSRSGQWRVLASDLVVTYRWAPLGVAVPPLWQRQRIGVMDSPEQYATGLVTPQSSPWQGGTL